MNKRGTKKSETLEVRLSHEAKRELMRKARAEGRSASDVIRDSIDSYLADHGKEARSMLFTLWKPAAAAGAVSLAILWSALSPAPVSAGPDFRAAFERLDENGDGAITQKEFIGRNPDMMFVEKARKPATDARARPFILPLRREIAAPPPGASRPPEAMLRSHYAELDSNRDGQVSFAEFEAFHSGMLRSGFAAIDLNGDGSLDRGEFEVAVRAAPGQSDAASFDEIDANGDGRVSAEEFFS